jgi:hypothetical protein
LYLTEEEPFKKTCPKEERFTRSNHGDSARAARGGAIILEEMKPVNQYIYI